MMTLQQLFAKRGTWTQSVLAQDKRGLTVLPTTNVPSVLRRGMTQLRKTEPYVTGTGQQLYVHARETCVDTPCCIHSPSPHSMFHYPTHWRKDRKLMERICPHGVGHPDPDHLRYIKDIQKRLVHSIHGCDGCCQGAYKEVILHVE